MPIHNAMDIHGALKYSITTASVLMPIFRVNLACQQPSGYLSSPVREEKLSW